MSKVKMNKALKGAIMKSAILRFPRSVSARLTHEEQRTLEAYFEKVVGELVKEYGADAREDFEISKDTFKDHLEAFYTTQPRIAADDDLKKITASTARELVAEWVAFIRRSELIKQLQTSAQEFVSSLR